MDDAQVKAVVAHELGHLILKNTDPVIQKELGSA